METKRLITAEELWNMPEVPGKRFELVDGEIVEVPGAGGLHAKLVMLLLLLLDPFVAERKLGEVFGDGLGYIIRRRPDRMLIPDVSFISRSRIPKEGVPEGFIPFASDLAVEVVSPNDTANAVHEKVQEYLGAGTQLVWVLWPRRRGVSVHEQGGITRELGPEDELDGGNVLWAFG